MPDFLVWLPGTKGPRAQVWRNRPFVAVGVQKLADNSPGVTVLAAYLIEDRHASCTVTELAKLYAEKTD